MSKVLFIGRRDSGEKNDVAELAKAVSNQAGVLKIDHCFFEDIALLVSDQKIKVSLGEFPEQLTEYSLIVMVGWSHHKTYMDLAGSIAKYANSQGVKVWNSELISSRSMTKISQVVTAALNGVSVPDTVFSLDTSQLLKSASVLDFPMILKSSQGSRGRNNYLMKSKNELAAKTGGQPFNQFLAQEYVPNEGSDFRVLIANGKPALCIKREGQDGSHLNNISTGAKASLVKLDNLPKKIFQDSEVLAKAFRRELCGIDFMIDKRTGHNVFIEVNLTPQIVNGVFVKEKTEAIAQAILTQLERDKR